MSRTENSLTVVAPARLHFGLFSIGNATERRFGGMGLMIDQPATEIQILPDTQFQIEAPAEYVAPIERAAENWLDRYRVDAGFPAAADCPDDDQSRPECRIRLISAAPRHSGFGSGTQLAMATAAALFRFFDLPVARPEELGPVLGRGARSAIGTYGFFSGGLLVDRGKTDGQPLAPLDFQIDFPDSWPIVVARLQDGKTVSGTAEKSAFAQLPDVVPDEQQRSIEIVQQRIIPAILSVDYGLFAKGLFEFGYRSGRFFQKVQGGPYNGTEIEKLVDTIRNSGVQATGQSSWGPAVFAVAQDDTQAGQLKRQLETQYGDCISVTITRANHSGMRMIPADETCDSKQPERTGP